MNVFYENEHGILWHGDCLEVMKLLPIDIDRVDMVLSDPPYGTTQNKWDSVIDLDEMWKSVNELVNDNTPIILTSAQPFTSALIMSNIKKFRYQWVWAKSQAVGHLNAYKMPMREHEDICVFYNRLPTYNPQIRDKPKENIRPAKRVKKLSKDNSCYGKHTKGSDRKLPIDKSLPTSIIKFNSPQNNFHPTEKPVDLFSYLISTYTNQDDKILDFCAGSGTTAIAAEITGRKWVLIEKEEKYCDTIVKRLNVK